MSWYGVRFGNAIPKKTRDLLMKNKPEKCPDCGSTNIFPVVERFAVEGNTKRQAYWICDDCARKFSFHDL